MLVVVAQCSLVDAVLEEEFAPAVGQDALAREVERVGIDAIAERDERAAADAVAEFHEVVDRLEAGQPPEEIEASMPDLGGPGPPDGI